MLCNRALWISNAITSWNNIVLLPQISSLDSRNRMFCLLFNEITTVKAGWCGPMVQRQFIHLTTCVMWGCPCPLAHSRRVPLKAVNLSRKLITVSSPCVHGRGCESVVRGSRGTAQSWAAALSCTGTRFKCTRMGLTLIWRSCGGLLFKTTRSLLQLLISLCFNFLCLHPCAASQLGGGGGGGQVILIRFSSVF